MEGMKEWRAVNKPELRGIIPNAMEHIFERVAVRALCVFRAFAFARAPFRQKNAPGAVGFCVSLVLLLLVLLSAHTHTHNAHALECALARLTPATTRSS
jgi:hypothetical protein